MLQTHGAVPLHIVAGFLGTGKTTAIRNQLAARSGERAAVIVNDFGTASLDAGSLAEVGPFRLAEIPGACVCCTAPEGFVDALGTMLATGPDRIWIEPTGLARPQDLVDTVRRSPHAAAVALQPLIVLVDPRRLASEGAPAEEPLGDQAHIADVLVANRCDLASQSDIEAFEHWAGSLWPGPIRVVKTSRAELPGELFAWPEDAETPRHRVTGGAAPHAHDHSTAGFHSRSWSWAPEVLFSYDRLWRALEATLEEGETPALERFKGVFRTLEGVFLLEIAGAQLHRRPVAFRRESRADAIVSTGREPILERLDVALADAVLRDEELALPSHHIEIALPDGRTLLVDRERLLSLPSPAGEFSTYFPKRRGEATRLDALWESLELPNAGWAIAVAADGFASQAVPLTGLRQGFLLHSVEGDPLPEGQGGPFRLLIPEGTPGVPSACANVKGLAKLVLRE